LANTFFMNVKASPLKIGIIGTGYAAKKRAEAIALDRRCQLVAVTGSNHKRLEEFSQNFQIEAIDCWNRLVNLPELDLIFVCTINQGCGAIARAALLAQKHVVVEYPLDLETEVAAEVIDLAAKKQKLLHVEHIELIGGLHQALKQYLPQIGKVFYARYATISSQHSVGHSWKYHRAKFGFPLSAALSRIHRLTDLLGPVKNITCSDRYWNCNDSDYFTACLCQAQLNFNNGAIAEITYGKGDTFWHSHRTLEIYGEQGQIIFKGEKGTLIVGDNEQKISVVPRRGLFARDTTMVLDYLFDEQPLYLQPQASLYALRVANAARESSLTNKIVHLD
jgi:biliverdin reductase